MAHDITLGKDFKLFFQVVAFLWLLSVAGSFFSFFTLAYIDKMHHEAGKKARANIKVQHTTGRTGCARIAYKMKKESPTGEVNRTELYLATHITKNSDLNPQQSQMIILTKPEGL
ncbi:reticulon-like protein B16 [Iris pallida]|uniref:Reticulon-like protein B16 n=1 Tax=Iris pallida TaxID=29817 RepID=A0AAX6IE21_IRIPA|nr:reticulon-like protein B16 [Iris pallida]KAJ6852395.1 reticulon-like protein B16 [Iris pallida]